MDCVVHILVFIEDKEWHLLVSIVLDIFAVTYNIATHKLFRTHDFYIVHAMFLIFFSLRKKSQSNSWKYCSLIHNENLKCIFLQGVFKINSYVKVKNIAYVPNVVNRKKTILLLFFCFMDNSARKKSLHAL